MQHSTRRRIRWIATCAVMFLCGLFTGVGIMIIILGKATDRFFEARQVVAYHRIAERALERRLDLDQDERRAISRALKSSEAEHEAILRDYEVKLIPIRRATFHKMRPALKAENQRLLDNFLEEVENKRFQRFTKPITSNENPQTKDLSHDSH